MCDDKWSLLHFIHLCMHMCGAYACESVGEKELNNHKLIHKWHIFFKDYCGGGLFLT